MADLESLKAKHAEVGRTPEGALKLWFDGVFLYMDPATRDVGRELLQHLTIPFKKDAQWDIRPSGGTFSSRLKDPAHHHIFRSYAKGTSPENGYAMDPTSYELAIEVSKPDPYQRGYTVAVRSSGADSARPVYMKQSTSTQLWYVDKPQNVYVGIRKPKDPGEEEFV